MNIILFFFCNYPVVLFAIINKISNESTIKHIFFFNDINDKKKNTIILFFIYISPEEVKYEHVWNVNATI